MVIECCDYHHNDCKAKQIGRDTNPNTYIQSFNAGPNKYIKTRTRVSTHFMFRKPKRHTVTNAKNPVENITLIRKSRCLACQ